MRTFTIEEMIKLKIKATEWVDLFWEHCTQESLDFFHDLCEVELMSPASDMFPITIRQPGYESIYFIHARFKLFQSQHYTESCRCFELYGETSG